MIRCRQTILITGASSGIGKVTSQHLAAQGYQVVAAMRDTNGKNSVAASELRSLDCAVPIQVVEIDVLSDDSVSRGVENALKCAGPIDVLVNCAGVMWNGIAEAFSAAQFQSLLDTNLVGPFRLFKAVLPHMRRRKSGLCITISSLVGRTFGPGMGIYAASKSGLEALAEIIGYEIASQNIDSVIIEPGMFQTNLIANQQQPDDSSIAEAYHEHFSPFEQIQENVHKMVMQEGVENTDPQLVADLVQEIVETPAGKRPLRITVGLDYNTAEFNNAAAPQQKRFLEMLGFVDGLRVKAD